MGLRGESPPPSVFLRQVSGLVKAAGLWDVFIYNVGLISVGIGVAYTHRFGTAYYPNSSVAWATLLAAALMALVVLGFWTWTTVIPRSGGIYVFLTRAQHPAFGFAMSFVECVSWLFYVAVAATLIVTVGLIPMAAVLGGLDSPAVKWLASTWGKLLVASVVIWLAAALLVSGTRRYLRIQRVLFIVAVAGTVALLVALGGDGATFRRNFNGAFAAFGPDPFNEVLARARAGGWSPGTGPTFAGSVALLVWPFLPLIGSAFSIGIGGEVRNSSRNQILGMMGSLAFCAAAFVLVALTSSRSVGIGFQGALAYNYDNPSAGGVRFSTPFEPYLSYLACLATDSRVLRLIIPLGFICWVWFWIPGVLAYTERAFLAWALDRAAPEGLAKLHPTRSTPYVAVVAGAMVAQVFLILILSTDFFATLVFILAAATAWCVTLFLGVFFPLTARGLFASSPLAQTKLLGVPVMSVLCAAGAAALGVVVYLLWNDPVAAGHSAKSLIAVGVTFGAGFVFYLVMRTYRSRHGIDISRAYREIPVE